MRRPATRLLLAFLLTAAVGVSALAQQPRRSVAPTAVTEAVNWTAGVTYSYDGAGNVTAIGQDAFLYDDVGRVVTARVNGRTQSFTYDAFGNRLSCTGEGDCQYGMTVVDTPSNNRLAGATYDGSGNVVELRTPSGTHTYGWDGVNMMTSDSGVEGTSEFVYTADDERIAVHNRNTASWNWTVRDTAGRVLREFSSTEGGAWSWRRDYLFRDGLLLASRQPQGTATSTYHYHLDHLGTPRRITDDTDAIVGSHDYSAFGAEIAGGTNEPSWIDLKYTGHERDTLADPLSLDYMHARFYNHSLGRFLSVDPTWDSADLDTPQSWNRYAYVRNNPMNATDPDGRVLDTILDIAFIADDVVDIASTYIAGDRPKGIQWAALGGDVVGAAVPFLTGVGKGIKLAARADDAMHAAEATEHAAEAGVKAFRGGENSAAKIGREAHGQLAEKVKAKPGWQSEPRIVGPDGKIHKPDAITPSGRPVELKPNTPSGRKAGAKQIKRYEDVTGKKGRVIYYDPNKVQPR